MTQLTDTKHGENEEVYLQHVLCGRPVLVHCIAPSVQWAQPPAREPPGLSIDINDKYSPFLGVFFRPPMTQSLIF